MLDSRAAQAGCAFAITRHPMIEAFALCGICRIAIYPAPVQAEAHKANDEATFAEFTGSAALCGFEEADGRTEWVSGGIILEGPKSDQTLDLAIRVKRFVGF